MDYLKVKNKTYTGTLVARCDHCNNSFRSFPSDNRKYCSKDCYLESRKAKLNICSGCGIGFKIKGSPHQKYCGRSCYSKSKGPWNKGLRNVQPKLVGECHPGIKKRMRNLKISWIEYNNWKEDKKRYYKEVWRITNQQPLDILSNFDKPRGRAGSTGAYQLDHIFPISEGFKNKTDPAIVGNIKNLQFIPWLENCKKQNLKKEL